MRRLSAFLAFLLMLALVAVGCPPRELVLEIDQQGMAYLVAACAQQRCSDDPPASGSCCTAAARPQFTSAGPRLALQVALVERLDDGRRHIRSLGTCMQVGLSCFVLPDEDDRTRCLTLEAQALLDDSASADGLTYDDLDPDRTDVILAAFAALPDAPQAACAAEQLLACAAFAPAVEDPSIYRIACARCTDHRPFPSQQIDLESERCFGECFIERCQALFAAGVVP